MKALGLAFLFILATRAAGPLRCPMLLEILEMPAGLGVRGISPRELARLGLKPPEGMPSPDLMLMLPSRGFARLHGTLEGKADPFAPAEGNAFTRLLTGWLVQNRQRELGASLRTFLESTPARFPASKEFELKESLDPARLKALMEDPFHRLEAGDPIVAGKLAEWTQRRDLPLRVFFEVVREAPGAEPFAVVYIRPQ